MDAQEECSALILEGNRIMHVSDSERETISKLRTGDMLYDLEGRYILPGFIDSHAHISTVGMMEIGVDLSGTNSKEEAYLRIREKLKSTPRDAWIYARGWDETLWNGGYLTRDDLDQVSKDRCIVAVRICGHLATVNTAGLSLINDSLKKYRNYYDSKRGILREDAVGVATKMVYSSPGMREMGILLGQKRAITLGVTSVHDIVSKQSIQVYQSLWQDRRLMIRSSLIVDSADPVSIPESVYTGGDEWMRVAGVKAYMDGSIGARTAALHEPYADDPENGGTLLLSKRRVTAILRGLAPRGVQVCIHAIGDRAIDEVMGAFSGLRPEVICRIEHAEMISSENIRLAMENEVVLSMQPNFIGQWGQKGGMYEQRLGKKRASLMNPLRKIMESGVTLVFGSDCMPIDPLYGIRSTVNAPYASQRLKPIEALRIYTTAGAALSGESHLKGTISKGKLADLVILSHNPIKDLANAKVDATIINGQIVWTREHLKKRRV